jgi:regulator of sigma E protease
MEGSMLTQAAGLILSLSILIVLHEFGHYLTARWFKIRVEKFYLFFNPWFSLFKKKIGDTVWGIGWLPLGGYVKLAGMIDESNDKEQMEQEPKEDEFRSKPAWQRLIVMSGGVIVNMVLGIFLFMMTLFVWGEEYIATEDAKYGIICDSVMLDNGFQNGDIVLTVGDQVPRNLASIGGLIILDGEREVAVKRDGETVNIVLPEDIHTTIVGSRARVLFSERGPFYARSFVKESGAEASGLEAGDKIIAVNDVLTPYFDEFKSEVSQRSGEEIMVHVQREGRDTSFAVSVGDKGEIGMYPRSDKADFNWTVKEYSFFESIPAGFNKGINTLSKYVRSMSLLFTKEGATQMGGFGAIGGLFPKVWNWQAFWEITAFISIILAFMNVLPIPALDGGYIMFLFYEMISGRQVPDKVIEKANFVGFLLLIALLLFANGNDVFRAFTE